MSKSPKHIVLSLYQKPRQGSAFSGPVYGSDKTQFSLVAGLILTLSLLPNKALAEPHKYELDPEHTTVAFTISHIGYAGTLGVFGDIKGTFSYDMKTQKLSDVNVTVETKSINTFNEARDKHVRNKDFLDVTSHPTMNFSADSGTPTGADTGTVTGELTLLGKSVPLTLDVKLNKAAEYPFGHKRLTLGLTIRGKVKRSDFGMTYGVANGLVGDEVDLIIEAEAMRMK